MLGAPSLRRAHLDQVVAALWPGRAGTRRAYSAALAQRNALLSSIRAGRASRASLPAWDAELARHGVALMADRAATVERLRPRFAEHAAGLGLEGKAELRYKPRATDALAAELAERHDSDLERGFTGHGPHRDDLAFRREGRELRSYGSRGQQRLGLLALLLAEREELAAERGSAPLLLLDDVMSELDATRRERLTSAPAPRRPGRDHDDRARARPGRRTRPTWSGSRSRTASCVRRSAPAGLASLDAARAAAGRSGVRRQGPRPVSFALDALADTLEPPTLLAAVQRVWPAVVRVLRGRLGAGRRARRGRDRGVRQRGPRARSST